MNNGMTATSSYRSNLSNRSHRLRRPGFMEPLGCGYVGDGGRRRSRSFPIQDDAGYIGYLSDDGESVGSGDEGLMNMVSRRRRELLGIDCDVSFSACCLLVVIVLMMGLVVVWGGSRFASSGTYDAV
jgi:hypothetical protein